MNEKNIDEFIKRKIEESVNLEYKDIQKYQDPDDLGAKISSLANTDGGLLILGIREEEIKEKGKAIRIFPKEITWGDFNEYTKETLENRLYGVIKPWISGLKIIPIRHSETKKVIFLIDIPKSDDRPHMAKNKFHYRINFSSIPMEYDHVKSMFLETFIYKQDIIEKFFSPIYSDIDIITENILYDSGYDTSNYDKLSKEYRLLLAKFNDNELKNNINSFYKIIKNRNKHLYLYEERGKNIINKNVEKILQQKNKVPTNQDIIWLEVNINIEWKNMKKGTGGLTLVNDLLFKHLGHSIERSDSVESFSIDKYIIHTGGGPSVELRHEEFNEIWEQILKDSDQDPTFQYLRNAVKNIKHLGLIIKKKIEEL